MKDHDLFKAMEYADEETLSILSEIPVLSDEEKERMFNASKRKAEEEDVPESGAKIIMMETTNKKASGTSSVSEIKVRNRAFMNVAAACVILVLGAAVVMNGIGNGGLHTSKGDSEGAAAQTSDSAYGSGKNGGSSDSKKSSSSDGDAGDDGSSVSRRRYNVSGVPPYNEEYIEYDITDEEQLDRIDEVLDEIDRIKDECVSSETTNSGDIDGILLNTTDDVKYFISMVGDHPYLTINFIDYDIPQELIDSLMAVIAPTATGQYAEAMRLLDTLNRIDKLAGGADIEYEDANNGSVSEGYMKVTGCDFGSVDDINSYMNDNLTSDFINALYPGITGTDRPMYISVDGELYVDSTATRDCGYSLTETELVIADVTASSFTATAEYYTSDGTSQLKIYIVNEDGKWKISGIDFL